MREPCTDAERRDPHVGQAADVSVPFAPPAPGFQAGRQEDLATLEEGRRVEQLARGHPPDVQIGCGHVHGMQCELVLREHDTDGDHATFLHSRN